MRRDQQRAREQRPLALQNELLAAGALRTAAVNKTSDMNLEETVPTWDTTQIRMRGWLRALPEYLVP